MKVDLNSDSRSILLLWINLLWLYRPSCILTAFHNEYMEVFVPLDENHGNDYEVVTDIEIVAIMEGVFLDVLI